MSNRFNLAREQADQGRDTNSVMRLMGQMMRLPFTAFFYSMEIFARTIQGMQRMADQGFNSLVGGVAQNPDAAPGCRNSESMTGAPSANTNYQTTREEDGVMWDDQDLSGDDLKYVSYSILFTKRDLEATLEKEEQDVVNYSTNGGSYGGLKIAEFVEKVREKGVPRPEVWKDNNYPDANKDDEHWKIPDEDKKYITFIYRVNRRIDRQDADYDKQQVDQLRKIKDSIDGVSRKIG